MSDPTPHKDRDPGWSDHMDAAEIVLLVGIVLVFTATIVWLGVWLLG